jgi:anti-sigma B factor antagonist
MYNINNPSKPAPNTPKGGRAMDQAVQSAINTKDNCWDIALSGEFDIFNSSELKKTLTDLTKEKPLDMHIDCENITFLDSTALGSLVAVLKSVKSYEGKMLLKNLKPNVYRLFKITNLDRVFEIAGDTKGK